MALTSSLQNSLDRYVQGGATTTKSYGLGWWNRYIFPTSYDDIRFTVTHKYVNRPDLIAYDVYKISQLEWLVLQYNNILNVKSEIVLNAILMLPTPFRVQTQILIYSAT